jgi:serine/threonine protein kinase/tetratricopeptide (TPR) repeat protein
VAGPGPSPDSGQRIGAYEIQQLLGRGGMGEVFLAWDARLRRRVAIKRLRTDRGIDPALRGRLLREARAVAGLSHSAIVQVYDLVEEPGGDCLVLEYVEGRTLAATLAGGALDPALAVRLAQEIADGLAAAHAAGIVHRDLKAENVIVTLSGHAKILDFGLARMRSRATDDLLMTQHGVLMGTFHMMSPEQARGGETDERSDLFALGLLIHEMLTGRSPFRGDHPLETLNRVISERAPRLDALRPDVPPRLGALVEKLLAKDPAGRPSGAAEVARELAGIAAVPRPSRPEDAESISDLPTGVLEVWKDPPEPDAPPRRESRRFRRIVAAGVAAAAILALVLILLPRHPAGKPVRVVVLSPEIAPVNGDERLHLVASGVRSAILSGLTSLEGIAPLESARELGAAESASAAARSLAAEEVLIPTVEPAGAMTRVSLRRLQGGDGRVLWSTTFEIPNDPSKLRVLADMVTLQLRRAYPGRPLRPGTPELDVRDEDYAAFFAVRRRLDEGRTSLEAELPEIERIVRLSPRFLEAGLLAAQCHLSLFGSARDASHLERARELVRDLRKLAPEDPRPLREELEVSLASGHPKEARGLLGELERRTPGDPDLLVLKAHLAESQGHTEEALGYLRAAVAQAPSWPNLYKLAQLAAQSGRTAEARQGFQKILSDFPENPWALAELGRMELLYGDPASAERVFSRLARKNPQRYYFNNLGLARVLFGNYAGAVDAFQEALRIDPGHVISLTNLADAQQDLGRSAEAAATCRRVLERLDERRAQSPLEPGESLLEAECLARLGRTREAVEIARRTLPRAAEDTESLYTAALVYTLAGDRPSALASARAALLKGMQPRWFRRPSLQTLLQAPELRPYLERPRAGG